MRQKLAVLFTFGGGSAMIVHMGLIFSWLAYVGIKFDPPGWLFYLFLMSFFCTILGIALAAWDDIAKGRI